MKSTEEKICAHEKTHAEASLLAIRLGRTSMARTFTREPLSFRIQKTTI